MKTTSTFFPKAVRETIAQNIQHSDSAKRQRDQFIAQAAPWRAMSYDELWASVFGATLPRSWMVWSDGYCPACKQSVSMYNWQGDPLKAAWKVACPHCAQQFPTNDFGAFYKSGLDASGVFDAALADRSLLFNTQHPDPADPLHLFGVDDGNGFVQDKLKWRFIATYLARNQWKQFIVDGIKKLAVAYMVTSDRAYSRRALVLLDRVADVFPDFDFATQGEGYETKGHNGYVTVWHDANIEQVWLLVAYDQVFESLEDEELIAFISSKAASYKLPSPKTTAREVGHHIQERLFRDALRNRHKVLTNFPGLHNLIITTLAVVEWQESREKIYQYWEDILRRTTAVDGVTGEKGLAAYACFALRALSDAMSLMILADAHFVQTMIRRVPSFAKTFRFHIDTWCLNGHYYPCEGDGLNFGVQMSSYMSMALVKPTGASGIFVSAGARPSMHRLMYEHAQVTGDIDILRALVRENNGKVEDCLADLTLPNAPQVEEAIRQTLDQAGYDIKLSSVNMEQWHIAILRSGTGDHERALWMDYDSGGNHSHGDALNLGLYAFGMDMLPDAGYPAVQFGGWETDRAKWYSKTAAHNTVVVDGRQQLSQGNYRTVAGQTRLWAQTPTVKAMTMSAPNVYGIRSYDRTVLMIDLDGDGFYAVDHFHVAGGSDHAWFMFANSQMMTLEGLSLSPAPDDGHNTLLRHFQHDASPAVGWSADWLIDAPFGNPKAPAGLHLRYTGLTEGATVGSHEAWYCGGMAMAKAEDEEKWLPRLMVRRQGSPEGQLASTFVGVIEPYLGQRKVKAITRLWPDKPSPSHASGCVLQVDLADGRKDIIIVGAVLHQVSIPEVAGIGCYGEGLVVRYNQQGQLERIIMLNASSAKAGDFILRTENTLPTVELSLSYLNGRPTVQVHSDSLIARYGITTLTYQGQSLIGQIL